MSNKSGTSSQAITLPSGGGAISGIGETFTPDPFTGTGRFEVPITVPTGRNGLQPELRLTYNSGNGNGPFGLGWELSTPSVSRKTSNGVPQYRDDANGEDERDTFILSGQEDLVHLGSPQPGVSSFSPRTEGLFAHILRHRADGSDTWRVATRDGLTSTYGGGRQPAVVADPSDRDRIFAWKLSSTVDVFDNRIDYEYVRDTGGDGPRSWDQLYLERVRYVDYSEGGETRFLVSVTLVYDERPDSFSEFRAGFEIRTRRRCRRIEIRTHADEGVLARTYELEYLDDLVRRGERPAADLPLNGVSLLSRVRVVGRDGRSTQELPPLEFEYGHFRPERQRFQPLEAAGAGLPPLSLANGDLETVDVHGNGLPDIVQVNGTAQFWRNLGGGRFDQSREMSGIPAAINLGDAGVQIADMNGDGRADLLTLPQRGYFPLAFSGFWSAEGFVEYPSAPQVSFDSDDIRLVDLDGDGVVDALRTGAVFELFFNDRRTGWGRVETRPRRPLPDFPDVSFADPRVKLADLNGDGLVDVVLVDQGRIDYWPYHGHGTWGRRITMTDSPVFSDEPPLPGTGFEPARVLMGDIDGDGLDDVVYIQADRITCWINRAGGGWSEPFHVDRTPLFTDIDGVRIVDVLGTGMAGVLWTTDRLPGTGSNYQFLDLTGGLKPYLLERVDNNMGAVTSLRYATSTQFYLADEGSSTSRWKAPLPFAVHVVNRVEVIDEIAQGRLTTEFEYHDGYWDGVEREFRGFGRVQQRDTESFADFRSHATGDLDERQFSPPLLTMTWFHQGPIGEEFEDWQEPDRSSDYWPEDPPAVGHVESVNAALATLPRRARRDALRTLRGSVLRREVYAIDGTARASRPFSVTEFAYSIREEAPPAAASRSHIFFPHRVAERITQWERGTDPMTGFVFTDDYDTYGQARRTIRLAVPRGRHFRRRATGVEPYLGTIMTTTFAQRDDDRYIVDRVASSTTHEIRNDGSTSVFQLRDDVVRGSADLAVVGQTLTYYDGEPFQGLALGDPGDFGAPVRTEQLVLTEEILEEASRAETGGPSLVPPYLVPSESPAWTDEYPEEFRASVAPLAGYTFSPQESVRQRGYFVQESRVRYDFHGPGPRQGLVLASRDALGRQSSTEFDRFGLLPVQRSDSVGLTTRVANDYRVLAPRLVTDVNHNRTAFAFTPLGLLDRKAVMGKSDESVGDTVAVPGTKWVYELAPRRSSAGARRPVAVRTIRRVHHVEDVGVPANERETTIDTVQFSDGFGRLVQTRERAEDVIFGDTVRGADTVPGTQADETATRQPVSGARNTDPSQPNVVVSGWQVYDNKGRIVEKYEPFFATGYDFAPPVDTQLGQRISMFYDPQGRVARTVHPDGSEERVVQGVPESLDDPTTFTPTPWHVYTYDRNDNAGRTHPTQSAAFAHHWNTPTSVTLDGLGRVVLSVERNRLARPRRDAPLPPMEELRSRTAYDIRGNAVVFSDALGRAACRSVHDLVDRPLRIESIDAGVQRMVFDASGAEIERRDSKEALTLRRFDRLGRVDRLWARDDAAGVLSLRERIEYGDGGTPDQPTSERSAARVANRLGAVHQQFDEAGLVVVERYDFKGNELEKQRRVIADDQLLRLFPTESLEGEDWKVSTMRVDWEPAPGGFVDELASELLDQMEHETSTRYDALDRVVSLSTPRGADGRRKELRLGYDRSGAIERVELDREPIVERIAYDAAGQRTLITFGNGLMTRYAYHAQTFRLVRLRSERFETPDPLTCRPAGAVLQDLAYDYDLAGNVVGVVERTPGSGVRANPEAGTVDDAALRAALAAGDALLRRFTYDPLYRLTSATGRECTGGIASAPWADGQRCGFDSGNHGTPNQDNAPSLTGLYRQSYRYDAVGNITRVRHDGASRATRVYRVSPASNRLAELVLGDARFAYRHDEAGNLVRESEARHFEWDHLNRMKSFRTQTGSAEPSVHTQYLYDAVGERVKKLVRRQGGAIESTTYIDGVFERHHRRKPGATESTSTLVHVMDGERRVMMARDGVPHPDDRGPAVQYVLGDHLGNHSVTVDGTGTFVNREEWTPYGETTLGSFAKKRFRFNGKERDDESGLNYVGARYYAPWLGRWTSCDPAEPAVTGSLNWYTCLGSNPMNLVDPDGGNPERPKVTGPSKAKLVTEAVLRWVLGDDPNKTTPAGDPTPVEPAGDDDRDARDKEIRDEESRRRGKNKEGPGGSRPGPGGAPDETPSKKWLPSGKRGQRSARRAEADRFHPTEETTRQRRGLPRRPSPRGSSPTRAGGTGGAGGAGRAPRLRVRGGGAGGLAGAVLFNWATEGKAPDPVDVVVTAIPIVNVATAKDHGDSVIPIIILVAGWKATVLTVAGVAVYKYIEAVQEQPILAVPPAAAGLGQSAHTLGAKGGYGNLLCYPGKAGCK
jgi:RHS repeat-associated protein